MGAFAESWGKARASAISGLPLGQPGLRKPAQKSCKPAAGSKIKDEKPVVSGHLAEAHTDSPAPCGVPGPRSDAGRRAAPAASAVCRARG